jgi:hypothetical protein
VLTTARARKIIATACTGASILRARGRRRNLEHARAGSGARDHEAFTLFQRYYAEGVDVCHPGRLEVINEGIAPTRSTRPILARRAPDR